MVTEQLPTPEEAVPDPDEQERPDILNVVEDAEDSGAVEVEDEAAPEGEPDIRAEIRQTVKELLDANPELAKELLPEPEDVAQERAKIESEKLRSARQGQVYAAYQSAAPFLGDGLTKITTDWANQHAEAIKKAAQDVIDGRTETLSFDWGKMATDVQWLASRMAGSMSQWSTLHNEDAILSDLEQSSVPLSADDRKAIEEAKKESSSTARILGIQRAYMAAAQRSRPEAVEEAKKKAAETDKELADRLLRIREFAKNGKVTAGTTGSPRKKGYLEMTREERAKLTPEETNALVAELK